MEQRFHTKTNRWSENIEEVIKNIGESCEGYKWMNIFAAKKNTSIYNKFMYSIIFIGPIAGFLSTIATIDEPHYRILQVPIIIISFFSGVLSAIVKFSKFDQKSLNHKSVAAKYASLEGNIRRQLSLCREDRVNAGYYLEWVSMSYDDLFSASPLISENIYNKWVEFAKKNGLCIPKQLGQNIYIEQNDVVKSLSEIGNIYIEKQNKDHNSIEIKVDKNNEEIPDTNQEIPDKNSTLKKFPRSTEYNVNIDLKTFTDKAMEYELSRLYNL